jgi:hypothetical protein
MYISEYESPDVAPAPSAAAVLQQMLADVEREKQAQLDAYEEQVRRDLVRTWKSRSGGALAFAASASEAHRCSRATCRIAQVRAVHYFTVHAGAHPDAAALFAAGVLSGSRFAAPARVPASQLGHVCETAAPCPAAAALHAGAARVIDDVYVCLESGLAHWCTARRCACTELQQSVRDLEGGQSDGGYYRCVVSGIVRDSALVAEEFRHRARDGSAAGTATPDSASRNDAHEEHATRGTALQTAALADAAMRRDVPDRVRVALGARRARAAQSLREHYMTTAVARISVLFSDARLQLERTEQQRVAALEMSVVAAYERECERVHRPLIVAHQMQLATARRRMESAAVDHRAAAATLDQLDAAQRRALVTMYAVRTVAFWAALREHTAAGRDTPRELPFYDFVYAALYMFADGLAVPYIAGTYPGSDVFGRDAVLRALLPSAARFESGHAAATQFGGTRTLTQLCRTAAAAVIDAVARRGVNPRLFDPTRTLLESIDERLFVPMTQPTAKRAVREYDEASAAASTKKQKKRGKKTTALQVKTM